MVRLALSKSSSRKTLLQGYQRHVKFLLLSVLVKVIFGVQLTSLVQKSELGQTVKPTKKLNDSESKRKAFE